MEYIDVRGVWPVYFNGMNALELANQSRSIGLEKASNYAATELFLRELGANDFTPSDLMLDSTLTIHQDEA